MLEKLNFGEKNKAFTTLIITHFCVNENNNILWKVPHYVSQKLKWSLKDRPYGVQKAFSWQIIFK